MKYRLSDDIVFTPLKDGSGVVLRLKDTLFYSLNETGVAIMRELEKGALIPEIVKTLCREFNVSEKEAIKDTGAFIEDLKKEKLITTE